MARVKVKVNQKGFKFERRLKKELKRILMDPKIGISIRNQVIKRMRGDGLLPNDDRIEGLKRSTIDRRVQLARTNKTHKQFSPAKSNLTFTGQWLDSFKVKSAKVRGTRAKYLIGPDGQHSGYRSISGKRGRSVSNVDIGRGLAKKRPWNAPIGSALDAKLERLLRGIIQKRIDKAFRRKR